MSPSQNPIQPKIKAVGVAAGATTILMWLLGYFLPDLVATAPVGAEAGITAILATAAGYLKAG